MRWSEQYQANVLYVQNIFWLFIQCIHFFKKKITGIMFSHSVYPLRSYSHCTCWRVGKTHVLCNSEFINKVSFILREKTQKIYLAGWNSEPSDATGKSTIKAWNSYPAISYKNKGIMDWLGICRWNMRNNLLLLNFINLRVPWGFSPSTWKQDP